MDTRLREGDRREVYLDERLTEHLPKRDLQEGKERKREKGDINVQKGRCGVGEEDKDKNTSMQKLKYQRFNKKRKLRERKQKGRDGIYLFHHLGVDQRKIA